MILLWLLACATCRPPTDRPGSVEDDPGPRLRDRGGPSGEVRGGRFEDASRPFTIEVPEGWGARAGLDEGELRVTLRHAETGAVVLVYARPDGPPSPELREGCTWTFTTEGRFRALPDTELVTVATCTPDDPLGDRTFGYLVSRSGWLWQIEVRAPATSMLDAKRAGDHLLRSLRW